MTPSLFRSLRGPIFLIVLGILFAADQLGGLSLGESWPAILIALGLLKLLERVMDRPAAPPPFGPGGMGGPQGMGGTQGMGGPQS